jgi:hypothetical protein
MCGQTLFELCGMHSYPIIILNLSLVHWRKEPFLPWMLKQLWNFGKQNINRILFWKSIIIFRNYHVIELIHVSFTSIQMYNHEQPPTSPPNLLPICPNCHRHLLPLVLSRNVEPIWKPTNKIENAAPVQTDHAAARRSHSNPDYWALIISWFAVVWRGKSTGFILSHADQILCPPAEMHVCPEQRPVNNSDPSGWPHFRRINLMDIVYE